MAKYRGKYPERINTVYSVNGVRGICVQTNEGKRFQIIPLSNEGRARMPKPGEDIGKYILIEWHYRVVPRVDEMAERHAEHDEKVKAIARRTYGAGPD